MQKRKFAFSSVRTFRAYLTQVAGYNFSPPRRRDAEFLRAKPASVPKIFVNVNQLLNFSPRLCVSAVQFLYNRQLGLFVLQIFSQTDLRFPDSFDGEFRHRFRAFGLKMRVVVQAFRIVRAFFFLQNQEKFFRFFRAECDQ